MNLTRLLPLVVAGCIWLPPAVCQPNLQVPAGTKTYHEFGRDLYQRLSCHGCHALHGKDGEMGPALNGVGSRLARGDLETQILTPRRRRTDSRMPSFAFIKPDELRQLLDFLQSLP